MKKNIFRLVLLFFVLWGAYFMYNSLPDYYNPERAYLNEENKYLTAFIVTKDSSTIEFPAGHFLFSKSLSLDGKRNVTIKGAGIDKTIISFKGQTQGAEGIRVANCQNITIENLSVEDAIGDNIKVIDTRGITFRRVKAAWTGKIDNTNGAYGLYPVLCEDVLIEECEVLGSSDAGIYVGQSENVIIRNNKAYMNVAGIESENSDNVLIYGNEAYDNTGGILVFNLPGLTRYGKNIEVYKNWVHNNNRDNFATKGSIVSNIPKGTGMLVLASNQVKFFDNKISNHKTLGIGIISYDLVYGLENDVEQQPVDAYGGVRYLNADYKTDKKYDPYPGRIYLYNNKYENSNLIPSLSHDFGRLFLWKNNFKIPDVVFDGIISEQKELKEEGYYKICIKEENIDFLMLDAANNFKELSKDVSKYSCQDI